MGKPGKLEYGGAWNYARGRNEAEAKGSKAQMEYISTAEGLENFRCLKEDFLTSRSIEHLGKKWNFFGILK